MEARKQHIAVGISNLMRPDTSQTLFVSGRGIISSVFNYIGQSLQTDSETEVNV